MDEVFRAYYLERARLVCSDVTGEHYDVWIAWANKNNAQVNLIKFIQALSKLSSDEVSERLFSWHMEVINGKKVRVEDHFDLIPAAPLKGQS